MQPSKSSPFKKKCLKSEDHLKETAASRDPDGFIRCSKGSRKRSQTASPKDLGQTRCQSRLFLMERQDAVHSDHKRTPCKALPTHLATSANQNRIADPQSTPPTNTQRRHGSAPKPSQSTMATMALCSPQQPQGLDRATSLPCWCSDPEDFTTFLLGVPHSIHTYV